MAKKAENPIPTGESFAVNGVSYHIRPRLFSSKLMRRLASIEKSKRREKRKEAIESIASFKDILPPAELKSLCETFLKDELDRVSVNYFAAAESVQDAEGEPLAIAMEACCEDITSQEHADEIIEEHGNSGTLALLMIKASRDDLEASGNLGSLLRQMEEEALRASALKS